MRHLTGFLLIFCIFFSAVPTEAYAQENHHPGTSSAVLSRFIDMLVESARTYWRFTDEAMEVNVISPSILLVNSQNPIDRHYRPESMINIANYVNTTRSPLYLEEGAGNAYIRMVASMREYGIADMAAVSGFRDFEHQTRIHNAQVERQARHFSMDEARRRAAMIVAAPGTSEHQTGLAVDVSSAEIGFALSVRFENTRAFRWLSENAHVYGFIIRYPRDSTDITGVIFEPWHLRYVGTEHSRRIFESSLTLEEYLINYVLGVWNE